MAKEKKSIAGTLAYTYRQPHQWVIDYDYAAKLPLKDRQWLSKFSEEFYNCLVKGEPLHQLYRHRRKLHSDYTARRYDIMGGGSRSNVTHVPNNRKSCEDSDISDYEHAAAHFEPEYLKNPEDEWIEVLDGKESE